jgi:hypothetical protein
LGGEEREERKEEEKRERMNERKRGAEDQWCGSVVESLCSNSSIANKKKN